MRRVLLAVPLKGELSSGFVTNWLEIAKAKIDGVKLTLSFLEGAPVHQARNEIADHAIVKNFDEVVMVDKDLNVRLVDLTRILCHDVPVVAGLYCQRALDTFWHLKVWSKEEKANANGLLRVNQCAIGFSKIKVSALLELANDNPDREGLLRDANGNWRTVFEFFPTGLAGPNTPEARLDELRGLAYAEDSIPSIEILRILLEKNPEPNLHVAEDYGFCALCRKSDIPLMVDTRLVVQHNGSVPLPIPTDQLFRMLNESWRNVQPNNHND